MNTDPNWTMWLYGSRARGDWDISSDDDYLLIADSSPRELQQKPALVSHYTWDEVRHMIEYGSLFLHHVKHEAVHVRSGNEGKEHFLDLLERLPNYTRAQRDIQAFRLALQDVATSLASGGQRYLEAASLAATLRHMCILGCHLTGPTVFGRLSAYEELTKRLALAGPSQGFDQLYKYRLFMDGRRDMPSTPSDLFFSNWLTLARTVLNRIERYVS